MAFFVVTTVHGPKWDNSRGIREQRAWDEHAAFMDGLVDDGFIIVGGPLGDGARALLVIEAADEDAVRARLGEDPWVPMEMLHIGTLEHLRLWLDGRRNSPSR
jgi:uncharacterized protein YciI